MGKYLSWWPEDQGSEPLRPPLSPSGQTYAPGVDPAALPMRPMAAPPPPPPPPGGRPGAQYRELATAIQDLASAVRYLADRLPGADRG